MMRWVALLQLWLGLAALFGLPYFSLEQVLGPERAAIENRTAHADAEAAVSVTAGRLAKETDALRTLVRRMGESAAVAAAFRDPRGAARALDSVRAQAGGVQTAAFLDTRRRLIGTNADSEQYLKTTAVERALQGVASVEVFGDSPDTVALVGAGPVIANGATQGAVLVVVPLSASRLRTWIAGLPPASEITIAHGARPIARTWMGAPPVPNLAGSTTPIAHGDKNYMSRARSAGLVDGKPLTLLAYAPVRGEATTALFQKLRALLVVLGGLSILIGTLVLILHPAPPAAEAQRSEPVASTADLSALAKPVFPPPSPAPATPPPPPPRHKPMPSQTRSKIDFVPAISQMPDAPRPEATPAQLIDTSSSPEPVLSAPPAPFPPPQPPEKKPTSTELALDAERGFEAPDAFLEEAPPAPAAPASPFDEIANAAFASAPPPPPPATGPLPPQESSDLPAPKGVDFNAMRAAAGSPVPPPSPFPDLPGIPGAPPNIAPPKAAFDPPGVSSRRPSQLPPMSSTPPAPAPRAPTDLPGLPTGARSPNLTPRPPPPRSPSFGAGSASVAPRRVPASDLLAPARSPSGSSARPDPVALPGSAGAVPLPGRSASSPGGDLGSAQPFDDRHYRDVYDQFINSKRGLGEEVTNITFDGFKTKLRSSEERLISQHKCRAVRFQVLVKDQTVSLRPQLVR